ncbi:Necrosis inducing protein npp1, partial [Globisporangium splendens]
MATLCRNECMCNEQERRSMSRGDNQLPRICFDDEFRVRVLEQESHQFATKLEEFHDIIKGVLEVLEGQAKRIEREKLKAIGQRNRVDSEVENRNRQKQMLESLIKEKQTELESLPENRDRTLAVILFDLIYSELHAIQSSVSYVLILLLYETTHQLECSRLPGSVNRGKSQDCHHDPVRGSNLPDIRRISDDLFGVILQFAITTNSYSRPSLSKTKMMKIAYTLLVSALACAATVQAGSIGHDQVVPFAEPVPSSVSEKAAIKFKPQIRISNGCRPYPAVDAAGNTSGGLKPVGSQDAGCKGSGKGTQVYGRSAWYKNKWAIMYSWYFPKDSPITGLGHRHDWEHVVVWIDNPAAANPKILAVTPSAHSGYQKYAPPKSGTVDGTSAKVDYSSTVVINHALDSTTSAGEKQPLIMWEQMTPAARTALENANFGDANVPMKDGNFMNKLAKAYYE